MKAHQLVQFANEKFGVDTAKCNESLFRALYEEGKNISLLDVLVQIGNNMNIDTIGGHGGNVLNRLQNSYYYREMKERMMYLLRLTVDQGSMVLMEFHSS